VILVFDQFTKLLSCWAQAKHLKGQLEILRYAQDDKWSYSCKLFVEYDLTQTLFPKREWSGKSNIGIKAWPGNGSGVERGGGLSKRYHMSHATGVANSIAWQFHPRGTHRFGLFSLDFLWFFLVSRQERTWKPLFAISFCCDATLHSWSLEYHSVHRITCRISLSITNITPLRGW